MSDKMTVVQLPGVSGAGFQNYGERTVPEMIETLRRYARADLERAEKILAAKDEDFQVEVVRGVIVGHHIKWLQNPLGLVRKKSVK